MSQAVVQAVREVQEIQNRFQNQGGQFAKGLQIVEAKAQERRKRREKQVQQSLNRARKYAKNLDNNINMLGYSNEETQIIKDMSIQKTNQFYALQGQLAQFDNPASPEAQGIVNEMNGIRNWFTNVEKQQKQRLSQREQYNVDLKGEESNGISIASQNQTFADNAAKINLESFSAIDPVSGEFLWGEKGSYMGLASGAEYIMNPGELFELIDKQEQMATAKKQPLTTGQINLAVRKFKNLIDDKNALAGLLASDNPVAEAYGPDLQRRFDEAYEADDTEALEAIVEECKTGYETYLKGINNEHVAELKAQEDPGSQDAPAGPFSNLSADSRALVEMFENGANYFSIGDERAYAYDEAGNISADSLGRPNPKYSGKPSVYMIGIYKDGVFKASEKKSGKIKAGNIAELVRIAGLR